MHVRGVNTLLWQLMGVTRFILFPPQDAARLLRPASSLPTTSPGESRTGEALWSPLGVVQYAQLHPLVARWPGLAQCAALRGLGLDRGVGSRSGDDLFQQRRRAAPTPFVDLHPGEVLFLPAGWSTSHRNEGGGSEAVAMAVEVQL